MKLQTILALLIMLCPISMVAQSTVVRDKTKPAVTRSKVAAKPKAQKAKKTSKKSARKAQPAATLTPALKAVDGKTFSYALGVAQGESLKQYLVSQLGVDSAYVPEAIRAMTTNISPEERKKAEAFAAGLRIAEINKRNLPMISQQAAGKGDSTYVSQAEFERGLTQSALGTATTLTRDSAMQIVEGQFQYQTARYKQANADYLTANAKRKGVTTLPSGLQYEVLTKGNGPVATDSTQVEVHYEGSLIDGTVFDSSYKRGKAATFRPDQVIKGWKEALTLMPQGSVWKLYIPASLGYGERGTQSIPGNSTLVFTVEVIKVGK